MNYNCSYDELLETHKLVPHPQNPNKHPKDQIERLSEIIDYQGQRSPIVICKQTGFIVVGHGRLEAMKRLGWDKVAVNYQTFKDDAQRYAHMTADNAIGDWSSIDLGDINKTIEEYGPELDVESLGLRNFKIEPMDKFDPSDEWEGMPEFENEKNDIEKAYCRVIVSFESETYLQDFVRLIDQKVTDKTKSIWHPRKVKGDGIKDYRYDDA